MAILWQDVRHGARLLTRTPGFSAVAIAALAIGIGANTAVFGIVNALLLRPLPYHEPERLAVIWEHNLARGRANNVVSPGNFLHWREMQQSFVDLSSASGGGGIGMKVTITGHGEPEEVPVQLVSASFFPLLGVGPALGRAFIEQEDVPQSRVAIISDGLWKRRYGGDPGILDQPITIQGQAYTLIGVMPPGFSFLDKSIDVWLPVGLPPEARTPRGRWMAVVGRLQPGVTFEMAQRDMERVHAELARLYPDMNTGWTANVVPLREQLTGEIRPTLGILLGAVAFVLLIACANVANLLLARATARQRELAVRAALGAGRSRIIRQLLAESLVLASMGAAAGLLLAWWTLRLVSTTVAGRLDIPRLETAGLDATVLAFTVGTTVLSALVFGLIPAFTAAGRELTRTLRDGGRAGSEARGKTTRRTFVVVEIALALVLLAGAGLLVRSFVHLVQVDPGFDTARTITMQVGLPMFRYPEATQRTAFFKRLLDRVDALPGVQSSGAVSFIPLRGLGSATSYEVIGEPAPLPGHEPGTDVRVITHDYFRTMGIPLLRGRTFNEGDPADAANRVIVNEAMARRHWPGEDPIGRRIRISWGENVEDEVIGVVGDVHHAGLDVEPRPTIYWPHARVAYGAMTLVVRSAVARPQDLAGSIVAAVRQLDPELAVASISTLDEIVAESVAERRLVTLILTLFALAALVLAAVGIYGVIAYSVTRRTQEIGIRMALGAQQGSVLRMIVGDAAVLALTGIALGSAAAFLLTRLMEGLLYGVRPADPLTFLGVAGILALVALSASYVPARRATQVDPVIALRAE